MAKAPVLINDIDPRDETGGTPRGEEVPDVDPRIREEEADIEPMK